jgi:hypothetical protein
MAMPSARPKPLQKIEPMASLNKNGEELFRLDLLRESRSYRSNGFVLINRGFGWKRGKNHGPEKIGEVIERRKANEEKLQQDRPWFCQYRALVQAEFPLSTRWKYLAAENLLGDDLDGIWATLDDDGIRVDLQDLFRIRVLRDAMERENKALAAPEATRG